MTTADKVALGVLGGAVVVGGGYFLWTMRAPTPTQVLSQGAPQAPAAAPENPGRRDINQAKADAEKVERELRDGGKKAGDVVGDVFSGINDLIGVGKSVVDGFNSLFGGDMKLF